MSSPVPKQGMQIDISTMQVTEKDIEKKIPRITSTRKILTKSRKRSPK